MWKNNCRSQLVSNESPSYPSSELNEMSTEETSGDKMELNEISRGKKWENNNSNNNYKHSSFSTNCSYNYKQQQNWPQDNWQGKQWGQRPNNSMITLTQESDHYVPTELSNFFRQIDLAMKLKWEELKKQGRSSNQVNEITEGNLIQAFGVTEDQKEKAAAMLSRKKGTKKWGISMAWIAFLRFSTASGTVCAPSKSKYRPLGIHNTKCDIFCSSV